MPLQPGSLVRAVEIDRQVMLGRLAHAALVELHHLLVVAVHVVDLDSRRAPFLVEGQRLVHLLAQRQPIDPEQRLDALLLAVGDDLRECPPPGR